MLANVCRWAAALALGAIGLAGCNPDTTEVSPNVRDQQQLENALMVDTFRLDGATQRFDSTLVYPSTNTALAVGGASLVVGAHQSLQTGTLASVGVFDFGLPLTITRFPDNLVADSLVIRLPFRFQHTPPGATQLVLNLHRLQAPFDKDSIYLASSARSYDATPLATATITVDTTRISGEVLFKLPATDTLLQNLVAFGKRADFGATYADEVAFARRFRGFALVPQGNSTPVVSFRLRDGLLALYGRSDTVRFSRAFNLRGAGAGGNQYFSYARADRTGSDLAALGSTRLLPASQASNRVYVQSLGALWGRVSWPTYMSFRRANPGLTLIRAVLELPADPIPAGRRNGPLPQLIAWQGTADALAVGRNTFFAKALAAGRNTTAAGVLDAFYQGYSPASTSYQIEVTNYLLGIENGTQVDAGLLLAPAAGEPFLAPFSFSTDPASARRAKLRAYFVRLVR